MKGEDPLQFQMTKPEITKKPVEPIDEFKNLGYKPK